MSPDEQYQPGVAVAFFQSEYTCKLKNGQLYEKLAYWEETDQMQWHTMMYICLPPKAVPDTQSNGSGTKELNYKQLIAQQIKTRPIVVKF